MHGWKLLYYSDDGAEKLKGEIPLKDLSLVRESNQSGVPDYALDLVCCGFCCVRVMGRLAMSRFGLSTVK